MAGVASGSVISSGSRPQFPGAVDMDRLCGCEEGLWVVGVRSGRHAGRGGFDVAYWLQVQRYVGRHQAAPPI